MDNWNKQNVNIHVKIHVIAAYFSGTSFENMKVWFENSISCVIVETV